MKVATAAALRKVCRRAENLRSGESVVCRNLSQRRDANRSTTMDPEAEYRQESVPSINLTREHLTADVFLHPGPGFDNEAQKTENGIACVDPTPFYKSVCLGPMLRIMAPGGFIIVVAYVRISTRYEEAKSTGHVLSGRWLG